MNFNPSQLELSQTQDSLYFECVFERKQDRDSASLLNQKDETVVLLPKRSSTTPHTLPVFLMMSRKRKKNAQ